MKKDSKIVRLSIEEYEIILKAVESCWHSTECYGNTDYVETYSFDSELIKQAKKILYNT